MMATVRIKTLGAWLLMGAMAVCAEDAGKPAPVREKAAVKTVTTKSAPAKASPVSGKMQVDEPKASVPMASAKSSKAWQKSHAKGLTDSQKAAFKERKESMTAMIAVIQAKRKAMHDAKPEDRAALARELHSLILEKDGEGTTSVTAAARVEGPAKEGKSAVSAKAKQDGEARRQAERREEYRKQMEKLRQWNSGQEDND